MTDQEAHDALSKMAREHIPLGGVNPPTDEEAAAGTMKDADPEEDPRNVALAKAAGPGGFDALAPSPRNAALAEAAGPGGFDALAPDDKAETKPGGTLASTVKSNVAALTTASPRPALTQPLGYRPPAAPKDPELEQLQANAKDRRSTAQLGQAVTDFNERPTNLLDYAERLGGGGTSAPPKKSTVWSDYEAEGEQPLKDLQARRASAAALRAQQAAAAGDADDSDPNSPRARVLRSILYKYNPDLAGQLDTATPKQLTAIGGPELTKMIEESGALEREKAKPDPKATAAADKAAQAESTRKLLLGPAYREQMAKEGHTPEEIVGLDDEGLKGLREHFEHDATNKAGIAAAGIAANRTEGFKRADKETAQTEQRSKQQIPGWEADPGQPLLDNNEIDAIRATKLGTDTMKAEIAKAMPVIQKYGRALAAGPLTLTAMQQIDPEHAVTDLGTIRSLTGTIKELGSVAITDAKRMPNAPGLANIADKIAGNANEMTLENLMGGAEATNAKLRAFADLMDTRQQLIQKSYRYHDAGAGTKVASAKPAAGKVHVSNGTETLEIDPSDVEAAKADGYQVLQ